MIGQHTTKHIDLRYRIPLSWETFAQLNGYCWFASDSYNGLFRFNYSELEKEEGTTIDAEFVGIFPNERHGKRLWSWIEVCRDYLVFVPLIADNFTVYDTKKNKFTAIPVKKTKKCKFYSANYDENAKFSCCLQNGNRVIFLPYTYPAVAVLDLERMTIEYSEQFIEDMLPYLAENGPYFWKSLINARTDTETCLWSPRSSCFVRFNLQNLKLIIMKRINLHQVYFDVIDEEKCWWMIPRHGSGNILKIDKESDIIQEISLPAYALKCDYAFADAQYYQRNIILFPKTCNAALVVNTKKVEIKKINFLDKFMEGYKEEMGWNFRFARQFGKKIYAFSSLKSQMAVMDIETQNVFAYTICLFSYNGDCIEDVRNLYMQIEKTWGTETYSESEVLSLNYFMKMCVGDIHTGKGDCNER